VSQGDRLNLMLVTSKAAFVSRINQLLQNPEMGSIGRFADYDVAIVDYDLGVVTGVDIAEYLPVFFGSMPMVLISASSLEDLEIDTLPDLVFAFLNKCDGFDAALTTAIEAARSVSDPSYEPPHTEEEALATQSIGA